MRSLLNSDKLRITSDTAFEQVLDCCAAGLMRKEQETWIDERIISCYTTLFHRGHAHSFEVWQGGKLVAGLYGVNIGNTFIGESMFTHINNASKYCLIKAAHFMYAQGIFVINCQYFNEHLAHMGAIPVAREAYLNYMRYHGFLRDHLIGSWSALVDKHFSSDIYFK